ncbi:hypothetical protein CI102_9682 [Trichoderma harzianum]|nr:hypothetical protein CI102_9682 [Trichoderma harzianum]
MHSSRLQHSYKTRLSFFFFLFSFVLTDPLQDNMELAMSIASRLVTSHAFHDLVGIIVSTKHHSEIMLAAIRRPPASLVPNPARLPKTIHAMGSLLKICHGHFLGIFRVSTQDVCKRLPRYTGILPLVDLQNFVSP